MPPAQTAQPPLCIYYINALLLSYWNVKSLSKLDALLIFNRLKKRDIPFPTLPRSTANDGIMPSVPTVLVDTVEHPKALPQERTLEAFCHAEEEALTSSESHRVMALGSPDVLTMTISLPLTQYGTDTATTQRDVAIDVARYMDGEADFATVNATLRAKASATPTSSLGRRRTSATNEGVGLPTINTTMAPPSHGAPSRRQKGQSSPTQFSILKRLSFSGGQSPHVVANPIGTLTALAEDVTKSKPMEPKGEDTDVKEGKSAVSISQSSLFSAVMQAAEKSSASATALPSLQDGEEGVRRDLTAEDSSVMDQIITLHDLMATMPGLPSAVEPNQPKEGMFEVPVAHRTGVSPSSSPKKAASLLRQRSQDSIASIMTTGSSIHAHDEVSSARLSAVLETTHSSARTIRCAVRCTTFQPTVKSQPSSMLPETMDHSVSPTDSLSSSPSASLSRPLAEGALAKTFSETVEVDLSGDLTMTQVKTVLLPMFHHFLQNCAKPATASSTEWALRYQQPDETIIELLDGDQQLQAISIFHDTSSSRPAKLKLFLVPKALKASKHAQLLNKQIGNLIGYGLYRFDYLKSSEVDLCRRRSATSTILLFLTRRRIVDVMKLGSGKRCSKIAK